MTWEGNDMISKKVGIVESIKSSDDDLQDIRVSIDGQIQRAYNYPKMTGKVNEGDKVILNTTAVELSLGTGGYHFVISNLNNMESDLDANGHIMKLRYTPYQIVVDSVEDHESKYHDLINDFESLDDLPVVVGTLHSMLTPFVASYKRNNPDKKIAINSTITIGNAFGGDYECINIYTALITAKEIAKADVVFVSMGPGIAGTGTKYGFTGIEQGQILDAVKKLGGRPIAIPRISFADKRDRHQGISHHSITVFDKIVNVDVNIPITIYEDEKLNKIKAQIKENKLDEKHNIVFVENNKCKEDLEHFGLKVKSMGRNYDEDSEFFDSASSAAYYLMEVCHD